MKVKTVISSSLNAKINAEKNSRDIFAKPIDLRNYLSEIYVPSSLPSFLINKGVKVSSCTALAGLVANPSALIPTAVLSYLSYKFGVEYEMSINDRLNEGLKLLAGDFVMSTAVIQKGLGMNYNKDKPLNSYFVANKADVLADKYNMSSFFLKKPGNSRYFVSGHHGIYHNLYLPSSNDLNFSMGHPHRFRKGSGPYLYVNGNCGRFITDKGEVGIQIHREMCHWKYKQWWSLNKMKRRVEHYKTDTFDGFVFKTADYYVKSMQSYKINSRDIISYYGGETHRITINSNMIIDTNGVMKIVGLAIPGMPAVYNMSNDELRTITVPFLDRQFTYIFDDRYSGLDVVFKIENPDYDKNRVKSNYRVWNFMKG